MKYKIGCLSLSTFLFFCGCWLIPIKYHDEKLIPYFKAVNNVQHLRDSLGFTPISENAKITLEGSSGTYDAMLHVYQSISQRTIAFKKIDNRYIWIGEQEIFTGPRKFETVDGTFNETIMLNYDKEPISGYKLNELDIKYDGPDSSYTEPNSLLITDVRKVIVKWGKKYH